MKVEDLDLSQDTHRGKGSAWEASTTKTKREMRKFAISAELSEHLKQFLSNQWRDNPEKVLLATRQGIPYDNRDIVDQVLHPILERLKIPRAGLRAFRQGNETLMDHLDIPMGRDVTGSVTKQLKPPWVTLMRWQDQQNSLPKLAQLSAG